MYLEETQKKTKMIGLTKIKRKTYKDREEARQDIFNYIEMFYNPIRRHGYNDDLSPVEFERRHFMKQRVPRLLVAIQ